MGQTSKLLGEKMGIKKISQMVKIFAKMKEGWLSNKDACFMCNSANR